MRIQLGFSIRGLPAVPGSQSGSNARPYCSAFISKDRTPGQTDSACLSGEILSALLLEPPNLQADLSPCFQKSPPHLAGRDRDIRLPAYTRNNSALDVSPHSVCLFPLQSLCQIRTIEIDSVAAFEPMHASNCRYSATPPLLFEFYDLLLIEKCNFLGAGIGF